MKIVGCEPKEPSKPSKVDRWYDNEEKQWVIQLKDDEGNQIGNAVFNRFEHLAIEQEKKMKLENNIT